jgi:hypothetical protein
MAEEGKGGLEGGSGSHISSFVQQGATIYYKVDHKGSHKCMLRRRKAGYHNCSHAKVQHPGD